MGPNYLFVPVVNSQCGPAAVTETSGCSCPPEGNLGRLKENHLKNHLKPPTKWNGGAKDLPKEGMRSMMNATKSI